jgi:hypothetical protein
VHPSSPWAEWDPTQPGSLKARQNDKRVILPEDLLLILESTPESVPDPLLREYLLRALRDELRRPKGRPASRLTANVLVVADICIKLKAEDICAERAVRGEKHVRGELEPTRLAADEFARPFGNITGQHLLNEISKMKKAGI